jgi:hypothetical protein
MGAVTRGLGRQTRVFALDSYGGMPETDAIRDLHHAGDFGDTRLEDLQNFVRSNDLGETVLPVKGRFEDVYPELSSRVATASLVHVDCDIYSAVRYAIGVARSKLRGGYLVFDDVLHGSCLGAMQAVEEELYHREKLVAEQVFPHLVFRYPAVLEAEPADSVRVLPIPAPSVSPVPAIASPEADDLEWTGERFVPGMPGGIRYEHLHRYALCRHLVAGKHVLDIASGEGYGSAALAGWAAHNTNTKRQTSCLAGKRVVSSDYGLRSVTSLGLVHCSFQCKAVQV